MYKIINKERLNSIVHKMVIYAPRIADNAKAGQFVMVMAHEAGERIPLTIYDHDAKKGTITIIFQEIGMTTRLLARMKREESLVSITGPLGHPTQITKSALNNSLALGVGQIKSQTT